MVDIATGRGSSSGEKVIGSYIIINAYLYVFCLWTFASQFDVVPSYSWRWQQIEINEAKNFHIY